MNLPSRVEIEKLANQIFDAGLERRLMARAQKKAQALAQVSASGNISGYLPAMIECGKESLKTELLDLADGYAEAFTICGMPCELWAEGALDKAALLMAGGTTSRVRDEFRLLARRTKLPLYTQSAGIERAEGTRDAFGNLQRHREGRRSPLEPV